MQMWIRILLAFLLSAVLFSQNVTSQEDSQNPDSVDIYKNIENFSKRSKFTKIAYNLIFRSIETTPIQNKRFAIFQKNRKQKSYKISEGKIIRHIAIETLDPFENSLIDTQQSVKTIFTKIGNKLHIKSRQITVRNLLLFRTNQKFDSILVNESERLLRSQAYVQDVNIFAASIKGTSDSVDVFIQLIDNWSIIPKVSTASSRFTVQLIDKNILGFGQEFQNAVTWNTLLHKNAYNTYYFIPSIQNTYIQAMFHYGIDEYKYYTTSLNLDRPFFSPLAKWAAGVYVTQQSKQDSTYSYQPGALRFQYKFNSRDYWVGRAWQIFKGNTENERATNLIVATRYSLLRYFKKSNVPFDSLHVYSNEDLYLLAIGITTRKYIKDHYIFGFGITEDVPVGKVYGFTGGYQFRQGEGRMYLGLRYAIGNYNKSGGYYGGNIEYGVFLKGSTGEQGAISAGLHYFSTLFEIRKWKFRQFVKPQVSFGIHRLAYEKLTLNEGYGLDGFNSLTLQGKDRLLCTFQTQSYAPWNVFGFRFGPYLNFSVGMLSHFDTGFKRSKLYSQLALGVLIKNEKLVFSTFQLSLSFFPSIPGAGEDIFKFNSFQTKNFGFNDFVFDKPRIATYQ